VTLAPKGLMSQLYYHPCKKHGGCPPRPLCSSLEHSGLCYRASPPIHRKETQRGEASRSRPAARHDHLRYALLRPTGVPIARRALPRATEGRAKVHGSHGPPSCWAGGKKPWSFRGKKFERKAPGKGRFRGKEVACETVVGLVSSKDRGVRWYAFGAGGGQQCTTS
jgi:hypothetical protein